MREHLSIYNFYFYFKILFLMICGPSSSLSLFFSWIPCRDSFTTLVSKTIGKVHITLAKRQHRGFQIQGVHVDSRVCIQVQEIPCGLQGLHLCQNEFYTVFHTFQPLSSFTLKIELSCPRALEVKDVRPISLVGIIYKLLAKVLVNRLKGVL